MNLLNRFRAWMNRDIYIALNLQQQEIVNGLIRLANSCASLEQAITDRLDIIEGRLDEMKPASQPETVSAGGHKRWTQRRDERVSKHFNVSEFVAKLQKAGTDGE